MTIDFENYDKICIIFTYFSASLSFAELGYASPRFEYPLSIFKLAMTQQSTSSPPFKVNSSFILYKSADMTELPSMQAALFYSSSSISRV